jgi:DNA-binding NarL/FixJ family response regulator
MPRCVLIADDNEGNREVCHSFLSFCGYETVIAKDGGEALQRLRERPFDLALIDLQMPVLNGYQLLRRIREDLGLELPVFVLTGYASLESCMRCLQLGATAYLGKPFRLESLESKLARLFPDMHVHYRRKVEKERERLSEREQEVLLLMREGLQDAEIAQRLYISRFTVNNHVKRIIEKLNVRNRSEAIAVSYRENVFAALPEV